jgi:hypothetical protein
MSTFRTITGSDWRRSIAAARIRREARKNFAASAYAKALRRAQLSSVEAQPGTLPDCPRLQGQATTEDYFPEHEIDY